MKLTLSRRLAAGAAAAVAFAIVLASVVVYLETQHVLRTQVDDGLRAIVPRVKVIKKRLETAPVPGGTFAVRVPNASFGGASGSAQVVAPNGDVVGKSILSEQDLLTAKLGTLEDVKRNGTHLRVFVTQGPISGDKLVVARPLTEVDSSLKKLRIVLLAVSLGGIALAAGLGLAVARGAIAPMRRLAAEAEHVADTQDLSRRMPRGDQDDEIDRLGAAFNTMLAALEDSARAQRQFVSDASHELRTPLTSLRTNIEVLSRQDALPPGEREKLLRDVSEQLVEMSALVAELVELARDVEHPQELEDVRLDLVAAEAIERTRRNRPGVTFNPSLDESLVRGVPATIERAVSNLLDNAAKWSPPGGEVDVVVRNGELAVRDRGPGIADEDVPFIFDRFYRAAAARSKPGAGLGLAIVREAAEAHGGRATVESSSGGARFRLSLPATV